LPFYDPIHPVDTMPRSETTRRSVRALKSPRLATGYENVSAIASAASGDANPRAFMSFLDSKNIEPLESGFIIGEIRSDFKNLSLGMLALLS
jgi:hypothetical protein